MDASKQRLLDQRSSKQNQLADARKDFAQYRAIAEEINHIYKELRLKKNEAIKYSADFTSFKNRSYDRFKGNNFQKKYLPAAHLIECEYSRFISLIDRNLDTLNRERVRYENLAANQLGLIGELVKVVNNLTCTIQNYTN